jgi:hypothetical protein
MEDHNMETIEIIQEIDQLPVRQRMLIVEKIIRSIREDEKTALEKAADYLYTDYKDDKNLTAFTVLDCENFYEPK